MRCETCDGTGWCCENHPNRPWRDGNSKRWDACDCGAGAQCHFCNPLAKPLPGSTLIWDAVNGYRH